MNVSRAITIALLLYLAFRLVRLGPAEAWRQIVKAKWIFLAVLGFHLSVLAFFYFFRH